MFIDRVELPEWESKVQLTLTPGKSIIIADADDRSRLIKYKKDFGLDKIKNIHVPMINLEPLRSDIQKLKEIEKADFRSTAESKDVKWKQRVADEIGVELEEEE